MIIFIVITIKGALTTTEILYDDFNDDSYNTTLWGTSVSGDYIYYVNETDGGEQIVSVETSQGSLIDTIVNIIPKLETPLTEEELISNCDTNDSIENKMTCIKKYIDTFYKHNSTSDDLILSFDDLKERGGDCKVMAELYERIGKAYGYNVKRESLFVEEIKVEMHGVTKRANLNHAVTIISNVEGYCFTSNDVIYCGEYGE